MPRTTSSQHSARTPADSEPADNVPRSQPKTKAAPKKQPKARADLPVEGDEEHDNDEDEDDDEEESGAEDGAAKPRKKRGNRGNFHGKRLALLQSWVPEYLERLKSKKKPWLGSGKSIWDVVFPAYWKLAPWRCDIKDDPPDDPEELKRLDLPPVGDEERKQKQKIMKQTELSIQSWFSRQRVASSKPNEP
ncbi:hypothetical protein C8F01DRAFT_1265890 [Mycena amicta]|nr:hypothetical protein C8F01DRAFT_1265890 [Mycena amicta]